MTIDVFLVLSNLRPMPRKLRVEYERVSSLCLVEWAAHKSEILAGRTKIQSPQNPKSEYRNPKQIPQIRKRKTERGAQGPTIGVGKREIRFVLSSLAGLVPYPRPIPAMNRRLLSVVPAGLL